MKQEKWYHILKHYLRQHLSVTLMLLSFVAIFAAIFRLYDLETDGHEYSGGTSNADGSLIKRDSDNIWKWKREELNSSSDAVELSIQFRIITEYVDPNYENIYPEDITKYIDPISWKAHFGESYFITITGDKTNGYKAVYEGE